MAFPINLGIKGPILIHGQNLLFQGPLGVIPGPMRLAFYGRIFNFKPSAGKDIDLPNLDIANLDKSA